MSNTNNSQVQKIEQFIHEVKETNEYKSLEYLMHSINIWSMEYFLRFKSKDNIFKIPNFLLPLVNRVGDLFCEKSISPDDIMNYMLENDKNGYIHHYYFVFIQNLDVTGTVQVKSEFLYMIITGFILDKSRMKNVDINEIIEGEKFNYDTNQYQLSRVNGVEFKKDCFIYDGKAYLYNILTKKSKIDFWDEMPGFAKIITEDVKTGDILLRVDERLAVPQDEIISYSTLNFDKFRGPQFHFKDFDLAAAKTIIVHIDPKTCDKLLLVIKKDYDEKQNKQFLHIEIETLPYCCIDKPNHHCITTFLHGMYYIDDDIFTHIDFTRNQYDGDDYKKKYADADPNIPVDFYAEKKLHYKIWCIENGRYSKETWYKLMIASLDEKYRILLDEILA